MWWSEECGDVRCVVLKCDVVRFSVLSSYVWC